MTTNDNANQLIANESAVPLTTYESTESVKCGDDCNRDEQLRVVNSARESIDKLISQSFINSRIAFDDSVSSVLSEVHTALANLTEAERQQLLDEVDRRESELKGDLWQVFKSNYSNTWGAFDRDAILRVANATRFPPPPSDPIEALVSEQFDTDGDLYLWILKRAKEGVFGSDALDEDMTRRERRVLIQRSGSFLHSDEWIQEKVELGIADHEFLDLLRRLKEWELKPIEQWRTTLFRSVIERQLSGNSRESSDLQSLVIQFWHFFTDAMRNIYIELGLVDDEFLEIMAQMTEWANRQRLTEMKS